MFAALPSHNVNMTNQPSSSDPNPNIKQICSDLQSRLKLIPEHLEIALIRSKATPEARHASLVFTNGVYHQINYQDNGSQKLGFAYGSTFRDFVRASARMFLLKPTLEAYSNNPHQNGEIPKTLFYLKLDAVEKQPDGWKTNHLPTTGLRDNPDILNHNCEVIGDLLKYQLSNLRTLIYEELPPKSSKLNESKKESQWVKIDKRLGILQGSSFDFQRKHADLVLEKDAALFSHKKKFCDLLHTDLTVPTLEDVQNVIATAHSPGLDE
ncbi:hypothetical protein PGT21_025863 [Puccinia graminis f. sp. tritici]|uniref:Uncharacterized protein n=1 Tax=Puccinia graminis f. sp. tritici TaxID=56615 RepID=A0A5B0NR92_PUCGR|nr:hypothetical protein PGT21_025863 [Puccinia graminis f. sp. tritici]